MSQRGSRPDNSNKKIKRYFPKRKTGGVTSNIYLRKTSGKQKKIRNGLQFEKKDLGVVHTREKC